MLPPVSLSPMAPIVSITGGFLPGSRITFGTLEFVVSTAGELTPLIAASCVRGRLACIGGPLSSSSPKKEATRGSAEDAVDEDALVALIERHLGTSPIARNARRVLYALANVCRQIAGEAPLAPKDRFWRQRCNALA